MVKNTIDIMDVDEVTLQSVMEEIILEAFTKIRFINPKILENEVQKALKSDTGSIEKYSKYFLFKYRECKFPIDQCWLASNHYNSCQIESHCVDEGVLFFVANEIRPRACAYLMLVKNAGKKKGIPMRLSEVIEEKLLEYLYWIINGQYSIYAKKNLRYQEMEKDGCSQNLIEVNTKRKT